MKKTIKALANGLFIVAALPAAMLTAFGRWRRMFTLFAQAFALVPGFVGEYARRGYYVLTIRSCSLESCICVGTFFARPDVVVESGVYIGSYCVIGRSHIGANTQIACNVHIVSGRHQHLRDEQGNILGSESGLFEEVTIGRNCWIGTSAIVMADVGDGATIGAGAVVTHAIPPSTVAVGNPARVVKQL